MASEKTRIWAERIARLERSGLTAAAFAAREGVNAGTLTHWKWRLRRRSHRGSDVAPRSTMSFVEVATPAPSEAGARVEVVLPAGYRVCIPEGASGDTLRTILDVLEARP